MLLTLAIVGVVAPGICLVLRVKRLRDQRQMEKHSISAEELTHCWPQIKRCSCLMFASRWTC